MDSSQENLDLFAEDHESLGQLVDRLDQIPAAELTAKWPKALAELVDVLACELGRGGMAADKALAQARKLALASCPRVVAASPMRIRFWLTLLALPFAWLRRYQR